MDAGRDALGCLCAFSATERRDAPIRDTLGLAGPAHCVHIAQEGFPRRGSSRARLARRSCPGCRAR